MCKHANNKENTIFCNDVHNDMECENGCEKNYGCIILYIERAKKSTIIYKYYQYMYTITNYKIIDMQKSCHVCSV